MHIHEAHGLMGVFGDAAMIAGFVFAIMLIVEYLNVLTSGALRDLLLKGGWRQYLVAVGLGMIPGCLGGFAAASMYSHGVLTLGALLATMIATTGDEAFVMLAEFPKTTALLTVGLAGFGMAAGAIADLLLKKKHVESLACAQPFEIHDHDRVTVGFSPGTILAQWKTCSPERGILSVALVIFLFGVVLGHWESEGWGWVRLSLLFLGSIALFITVTVPDHFLREHLWEHVARKHVPRIFAWTLGILVALYFLTGRLEDPALQSGIKGHEARWWALLLACVVGLIPQSGPHLVFVFAYAGGAVPLGVLVASCIVQDGHGMLPVLAESRRAFVWIKAVKFVLGLVGGGGIMLLW